MAIRFIYMETAYSYNPKRNDYGNTGVGGGPIGEVRLVRRKSYLSTKQGGTNKKIGISISLEQ